MARKITKKMVKYLFNNFDPSKASLSSLVRKEGILKENVEAMRYNLPQMELNEIDTQIRLLEEKYVEVISKCCRLEQEAKAIVSGPKMFFHNLIGTEKSNAAKQTSEKIFLKARNLNKISEEYYSEIELLKDKSYKIREYERILSKYNIIREWREKREIEEDKKLKVKNIISKSNEGKRNLAKGIRQKVFKNESCPYCGNKIDYCNKQDFHLDHIYPVSKGGMSTIKNMVYVCSSCNLKKGKYTLRYFIKKYSLDRDAIENRLEELGKDF